jgi:TRAP-type transport system periplasmic protein
MRRADLQILGFTRRTSRRAVVGATLVLALTAVASTATASAQTSARHGAASGPINLRFATVLAPTALGNSDLLQTLIKKTKGKVNIQTFFSGALGGEAQELAAVEAGTLDMAFITDATMASVDPAINIVELPFFWKSQKAVNKILLEGKIGQKLLGALTAKGMKGLAISNLGPRTVLSTKPINSVSDVQGLKVRVLPSNLFVTEWKNWGANPIQVDAPEVFTALQTGTVSAVDSNATGFASLKWFQGSAHYFANTNHEYTVQFLVMNQKKWNSLPAATKKLIQKAVAAGVKVNEAKAVKGNKDAIKVMTDAGVTVTDPPAASFLPGARQTWNAFKAQIGQPLVNLALALQRKVK